MHTTYAMPLPPDVLALLLPDGLPDDATPGALRLALEAARDAHDLAARQAAALSLSESGAAAVVYARIRRESEACWRATEASLAMLRASDTHSGDAP